MSRSLRWIGYTLGGLAGLLLTAFLAVWFLADRKLHTSYEFPPDAELAIPTGDSVVAVGERLAILRGCIGCHAAGLRGQMFVDEMLLGRIAAPNLSALLPTYSNAELVRTLRHGIARDGRNLLIMPSSMFNLLSDQDLGAIIAWLRTVPPVPNEFPSRRIGILGRLGLLTGQFYLEADLIDHQAPRAMPDTTDPARWGDYLTHTMCTECHGLQLEGAADGTPNLALVAGYTEDQFRHLTQTGEPIGNRTLGLMAEIATGRLVHLTENEVHAIYTYLRTLAAAPVPSN